MDALRSRDPISAAPGHGDSGAGPLADIRVLELATGLAGPSAGAIMADFGAEVIKIELPGEAPAAGDREAGLRLTNRNKKSVILDVRTPEGQEAFLALARESDILLENFRPGTLERWGFDPQRLLEANPRLIVHRASGYGQFGPYRERSSWNPVGIAFGGVTYLNGWPDRAPLRDGLMAGDYTTALFNVLGMLAAITRRDRDDTGQVVDVSMVESALRMTGDAIALRTALGVRAERAAGAWSIYPVSVTVEATDGRYVALSCQSLDELHGAVVTLGLDAAGDLEAARAAIAAWARESSADEVVSRLRAAGIRCSVVNSAAEIYEHPQIWARGNLVRWQHPEFGEVVTQGVMPTLTRTPGRVIGNAERGAHSEEVLRGILGYSDDRIAGLTGSDRARLTR